MKEYSIYFGDHGVSGEIAVLSLPIKYNNTVNSSLAIVQDLGPVLLEKSNRVENEICVQSTLEGTTKYVYPNMSISLSTDTDLDFLKFVHDQAHNVVQIDSTVNIVERNYVDMDDTSLGMTVSMKDIDLKWSLGRSTLNTGVVIEHVDGWTEVTKAINVDCQMSAAQQIEISSTKESALNSTSMKFGIECDFIVGYKRLVSDVDALGVVSAMDGTIMGDIDYVVLG